MTSLCSLTAESAPCLVSSDKVPGRFQEAT